MRHRESGPLPWCRRPVSEEIEVRLRRGGLEVKARAELADRAPSVAEVRPIG